MFRIVVLASLLCFLMFPLAFADTLDLSGWSEYTYDLGGQDPGNWVLASDNKSVTQTVNADPSMYLNNVNQTSYQMDGSWKVNTTSDDDFMGFVFGYQDDSHFYIMDWKQGAQGYVGGIASEGFSIKKISADSAADLTLKDFWYSSGDTNSTTLASSYGSDKGWADNTSYDFHLDFAQDGFSIKVLLGGTTLWDVAVSDNTYQFGQFGFYNFSQSTVQYSGFKQTGGVIIPTVPEPATFILLGSGLAGLAFYRRKRK